MADQDVVYCDDYTRLITYQSRSWTMGDLSLAALGGIQWAAAGLALGAGAAAGGAAAALLAVTGLPIWFAVFPAVVVTIAAYLRTAKERSGGLTELERLRLRLYQRYRQPTHFNGLAADAEPTDFQWDMTLWSFARPGDPT